ncbi:MAG: RNA polymerase sigma factor [Polyangiaceae bacterium]
MTTALRRIAPPLSNDVVVHATPATWVAADASVGSMWERARTGDTRALRWIYDRHAAGIHRFLLGLTKSVPAAHDATQETFARAFTRLDALQDPERLVAWLFGIARRVVMEQWKSVRREPKVGASEDAANSEDVGTLATPESILLGREAAGILEASLERLSVDRRAVLLLRVDHDLGYEAIAEVMGWSVAKAKVEVHRARLELRAGLQRYEEDDR